MNSQGGTKRASPALAKGIRETGNFRQHKESPESADRQREKKNTVKEGPVRGRDYLGIQVTVGIRKIFN